MKLVNMFNTFETGFQSNQDFDKVASFAILSLFFAIILPLNASGKASLSFLVVMSLLFERNQAGNHLPPIRIRTHSTPPSKPTTTPKQSSKKPSATKKRTPVSNSVASSSSGPSTSILLNGAGPLYSYDNGSDGVILLVDDHELGGDRMRLGELSRQLKHWQVQHKTAHLPCGDYSWIWRHKSGEVTLPVLVERKRADDLAESIKDGRFCSQKDKMKQWRKEFGMLSDEVCLHYIVESTPEAYRVRCIDGCGGVGKCGNPTVEQLEVVIMELERSHDFNLVQTENIETTVEFLASVSADLQRRVNNGDFEVLRLMKQQGVSTATNKKAATSTVTQNSSPQNAPQHSWSPSKLGTKRRLIDLDFDDDTGRNPIKCKPEVIDLCDSQDDIIVQSDFDESKPIFSSNWSTSMSQNNKHVKTSHPTNWNVPFDVNQNQKANAMPVYDANQMTNHNSQKDVKYDIQTANQNTQPDVNQDEEAKIMSVREVIPSANLDDILSALSSCAGNVEYAVVKLLDEMTN